MKISYKSEQKPSIKQSIKIALFRLIGALISPFVLIITNRTIQHRETDIYPLF